MPFDDLVSLTCYIVERASEGWYETLMKSGYCHQINTVLSCCCCMPYSMVIHSLLSHIKWFFPSHSSFMVVMFSQVFLHRKPASTLNILSKQATHLTKKTSIKTFFSRWIYRSRFGIKSWYWKRRKHMSYGKLQCAERERSTSTKYS